MKETLSDIKKKISNGVYKNEEHIRLSLVARLLAKLGWDIWNPNEVYTEYNPVPDEDRTKIDMALFSITRKPDVFIEVKAIGKINTDLKKTETQLRNYNRDNTALFSIITDGQNWRFYFSQTGGRFSEKCFKTIDLLDDDLVDIEESLVKFLSKSTIENGIAAIEAQKYLRLNEKQRVMEDKLPEAKRSVLIPPYPSLPEALIKLVAEENFQITSEEAQNFIKDLDSKPLLPTPNFISVKSPDDLVSPDKQKNLDFSQTIDDLSFTKIIEARIDAQSAKNWNSLLKCAITIAIQKHMSVEELQSLSITVHRGRTRAKGYIPIPDTDISFLNLDANRVWSATLKLAKKLRIEVMIKFEWKNKEKAAFPGKQGQLYWKP